MGYYTKYNLSIDTDNEKEIAKDLYKTLLDEESDSIEYFSEILEEPMKWYEHQEDMLKLSKKYKDTLFELSGEGEESGDIWTKWFKNGKVQFEKAKIVQGEFDESKLK